MTVRSVVISKQSVASVHYHQTPVQISFKRLRLELLGYFLLIFQKNQLNQLKKRRHIYVFDFVGFMIWKWEEAVRALRQVVNLIMVSSWFSCLEFAAYNTQMQCPSQPEEKNSAKLFVSPNDKCLRFSDSIALVNFMCLLSVVTDQWNMVNLYRSAVHRRCHAWDVCLPCILSSRVTD